MSVTTEASPTATALWRARAEMLLDWAGRSHARAVALLLVAAFLTFLPGSFTLPPTDRDESRFAQATKQMLETGDFIDIRLQDEARHKKPVGIYWLQAAAVALSGQGTAAGIGVYRIPSLIGAAGGVLLTYWAMLPLIGRRGALLAGLLTSSTILLGVEARIAKTDAVLFLCTVAAMGALVRAYLTPEATRASRIPWVFWVAVGVGALVKGPITLMVAGLAATVLVIADRSWQWLKALRPGWGVLLALGICAPWFVAIAVNSGGTFFRDSVGVDMLAKVGDAPEKHWGPPGYHLAVFWLVAWPTTALVALVLPRLWPERGRREVLVLLAWIIPTWIVFEAISTKLPHYVLPTYPAIMGLVALLLLDGVDAARRPWERFMLVGLWAFPVAITLVGVGLVLWFERSLPLGLLGLLAAGGLAAAIGWIGAKIGEESTIAVVPFAVAGAIALSVGVFQFALPSLQTVWLSPRMASAAASAATPACPTSRLASAAYHEPSLVFLTATNVVMASGPMAADFLAGGPCRLAFVDAAPPRAGGVSEEEGFLRRLGELGRRAERLTVVEGRNVNGGHLRRMVLWRMVE